jgi:hypothetical protein
MDSTETKHKPKTSPCQHTRANRLIAAATYVGQARILLLQERRDSLSGQKTRSLTSIADALGNLVGPIERVGRTTQPDAPLEPMQTQCRLEHMLPVEAVL